MLWQITKKFVPVVRCGGIGINKIHSMYDIKCCAVSFAPCLTSIIYYQCIHSDSKFQNFPHRICRDTWLRRRTCRTCNYKKGPSKSLVSGVYVQLSGNNHTPRDNIIPYFEIQLEPFRSHILLNLRDDCYLYKSNRDICQMLWLHGH